MKPRMNLATLGVTDLARAIRFYQHGLRLPRFEFASDQIAFFRLNGTWLALFPRSSLADDIGVPAAESGFIGFTLAHNVASGAEADEVYAEALAAGARPIKTPQETFWGGYSGYFADPDGFFWEVAHVPQFWIGPGEAGAWMKGQPASLVHQLAGGSRRSLGRANEVVSTVLRQPARLDELFAGLNQGDPVIRMRAADVIEKVSAVHPEWLLPYKTTLLRQTAAIPQAEVRWHVAQMLPRLRLTARERTLAVSILKGYLADESRIVKTCAMQALTDITVASGEGGETMVALLMELAQHGSPAMKARGRKLLARLRAHEKPCGTRCPWSCSSPEARRYHDDEWGVPSFDERHLFELLVLEGAQAGLSWNTILRKRAAYRRAFDNFEPAKVARYTPAKIERLLADPGIVRNRLKVEAAVINARCALAVQASEGSLAAFLWQFVNGKPRINHWRRMDEIPASTAESDAMSRELKRRGFKFVGTTICYAFMQAVGMVDDHLVDCPRHGVAKGKCRSPKL